MFKPQFILIIAIGLLYSCTNKNTDWIDRSKHEGLFMQELSDKFEIYSSVENPENIQNTIGILESAKAYYDQVFNEDLNFAVLFIDKKNWDKHAFSPPPGMPQAYFEGNMVLGLGKSIIASNAENGLEQAPAPIRDQLKEHFGENMDLDLFYRDALSLHELGHLYQFYKTGKNSQRRWLDELFGNLCQVGAARSLDTPAVFNQMDVLQTTMMKGSQWDSLKYRTLDQFESDYFQIMKEGQNYGWYQTQFFFMANELYEVFGDEFLRQFRNFLIDTDPENVGKLGDEELDQLILDRFGARAAEIIKWRHNR